MLLPSPSCRAFCTGVPVNKIRHRDLRPRKLFANKEDMFFILRPAARQRWSKIHGTTVCLTADEWP